MGNAEVRGAIAEAATTVPGVNVTPHFRQSLKPGDGMVRLERINRDSSGFGFMYVWQVLIALPQGFADAETFLDEKVETIIAALAPQMIVTTVTPQQLVLDSGIVPVVLFEGNRAN